MKIAIFTDCYLDLTGGITSSITAQKSALEADGHTVYIFSTSYPVSTEVRQKLAKKYIFPVPSCRLLFRGITPVSRRPSIVEKWLLRERPELKDFDIFYVHYEGGCSIAGLRLAKKLHIPSVQVMHGREDMGEASIIPLGFRTIVAFLLNMFHSWYLPHPVTVHRDDYLADTVAKAKMWTLMVNHANYADVVITPSRHFRKKLLHYGVMRDIKLFPNGYPDSKFPPAPHVRILRPGEELKIVWHSRLSGEKRFLPFLRALSQVDGKYRLDVYGGGADLARARRYASRRHLRVIFHGDTKFDTVQRALLSSHIDVLASYNFDNYPMTLVEAEAAGLPVLICDPDMKEIVPRGSYILSRDESPAAMATALTQLLRTPDSIHAMSKIMLAHRDEVLISRRIKTLEKIFNGIIKP